MFAGHVGAALALGRAARGVNLGIFMLAAVFPDVLLWLLVLLGWESAVIPADFARTHQAEFVFPYSHGLLATIGWSTLAGAVTWLWYPRLRGARLRAAALLAAAVFSHWLLDALVHAAELPIAGAGSPKVGLGLWRMMLLALATEAVITLGGLYLFVAGTDLSRARKLGLAVLTVSILLFTMVGMTLAPPPPSATIMAASSLVMLSVVCALAGWLARPSAAA
jgi:hypothetical protein